MAAVHPAVVAVLVDNHRRFLAFLRRRVETDVEAEEILQAAFVRGVERSDSVRDEDHAVAWFYRLLRNALADHYRRRGVEHRALAQLETDDAVDPELHQAICACLQEVVPTLKAEYAEILTRVDLEQAPLADFAAGEGLTAGNARVRLHRARRALKERLERVCGTCTEHACLDCACKSSV